MHSAAPQSATPKRRPKTVGFGFWSVDAAQSMGHVPLDVKTFEVDLVAAPGHKGLLGPLGTGVLYLRPGIERELKSFRCGGTGTQSDEDRQPDVLPDKYEPGNHSESRSVRQIASARAC